MTAPRVQLTPAQMAQVEPQLREQRKFTEADRQAAGELCDMVQFAGKEKELQRLCECELTRRCVRFFQHLSIKAREKEGVPDLIFAWRGKPCACELKVKGGRVSDAQKETMEDMRRDGWRVAVIWSYEAFVKFLEEA